MPAARLLRLPSSNLDITPPARPTHCQALFRPITVVVPDRQLIIENALMAEGFVTGAYTLQCSCLRCLP